MNLHSIGGTLKTEAQKRATSRYRAKTERLYSFRLSSSTYPRMIEYLNNAKNRQGLIKLAIAEKMRRDNVETDTDISDTTT